MTMQLNHDTAIRQYKEKGVLATIRAYPYQVGKNIRIKIKGEYAGMAEVERVLIEPNYDRIKDHTPKSGFKTAKEWIQAARELNDGLLPPYLVIIRKVE